MVRIDDTFVLRMCSRSVWVNESTRNTLMYNVRLEHTSVVHLEGVDCIMSGDLTECTLKSTTS